MQTIQTLSKAQRKKALENILKAFLIFCKQNFNFDLYDYEIRLARACLSSILVEPKDVFIKIARQSGKTEVVTLLLRFLMIFYLHFMGTSLMVGISSPKGEQAKTDIDRIKKSIADMRKTWNIEDREFNANTVRAYIGGILQAEIFRFSLAPTTTNESKTLNLLLVEEAHKVDDQKRSDQLDPMLSSTGGVTWMLGVGCVRLCDFYAGCKGELPDSEAIVVTVDEVIADKQKMYKKTKDIMHLQYKKAFARELRKKGRENPEIKRNYYLEDTIEEGNFVARERLLACARTKIVEAELYYLGIDWARSSDKTWIALGNAKNDVIRWFSYPSVRYEEQIELMMHDLEPYKGCIVGVCGDSTGLGDFPMEYLESNSWLPIDESSKVKFTLQSKNEMYTNFDAVLFKDDDDELKFSYPADDPLTGEFEEQMTQLEREYKGDGEYLSPHHPDIAGAKDDACFAKGTKIRTEHGEINIEDVKVGTRVLTRGGYKRVLASGMTGVKTVIERFGIRATPNHPFITKNGIKRFDNVNASDTIYMWNEKLSSIEEGSSLRTGTERYNVAVDSALAKSQPESVYNLNVEDCNEFFANNVLVHNCDATALMLLASMDTVGDISFV